MLAHKEVIAEFWNHKAGDSLLVSTGECQLECGCTADLEFFLINPCDPIFTSVLSYLTSQRVS